MSYPLNHLESIWYHSEPLEVPYYSLNQFLGWDFFYRFLIIKFHFNSSNRNFSEKSEQTNKKKIFEKRKKKKSGIILEVFGSFRSPTSRKENIQFPNSPDFDNFPDFLTKRIVRYSPIWDIVWNVQPLSAFFHII